MTLDELLRIKEHVKSDHHVRLSREEFAKLAAAAEKGIQPAQLNVQGHDEACYYCGAKCSALDGDPARWPVALCHPEEPGVVKWHHSGCVSDKLNDWQNMPNRNPAARGGYEFYINEEWACVRAAAIDESVDMSASLMKTRFDPDDDRVRVRLVKDDDALLEDLKKAELQAAENAGWQPIETAPQDGALIDVWEAGHYALHKNQDGTVSDSGSWVEGRRHTDSAWYTNQYDFYGVKRDGWGCWLKVHAYLFVGPVTHWKLITKPK